MDKSMKYMLAMVFCIWLVTGCEKVRQTELVLYDFESASALDEIHWKCHTLFSLSDQYAVHGSKSLKLELFPSAYPGLSPALKHHDWSGYQAFYFDVFNPSSAPVNLVLRVDDKKEALEYTDRYNKSFVILPGANTLAIPLDSLKASGTGIPLNLKQIYRFLVFMVNPKEKHVLYFDYFRLNYGELWGHHT
jgi:hypothetical protein